MPALFEWFIKRNTIGFEARTASAAHTRRRVWSVSGCWMRESVFVGYFCSPAQLGLVVFGTLMKRDGDKTWLFPIWRHCVCHWAFKVFYQQSAKWLCEICCAGFTELALEEVYSSQDVWLRGVEFPPFVLCLLCISYLNERSPLMWISLGPQTWKGYFMLYVYLLAHWYQWTLKCDINM